LFIFLTIKGFLNFFLNLWLVEKRHILDMIIFPTNQDISNFFAKLWLVEKKFLKKFDCFLDTWTLHEICKNRLSISIIDTQTKFLHTENILSY